ncbi:MAG: tetratricopeptide repeat protein [Bacteroidales bacterium]|nr:tetratricopeptide repeat protein [Bacteroidales bacterium]
MLLFTILLIFSDLIHGQEQGKDSLKLLLSGSQEKNRAAILVKLADITVLNDPDQAYAYALEAEQTARRQNQLPLLSDALKLKADALFYLDSLLPSLGSYLESAEVEQNTSRPRIDSILRRYGDAGYIYYQLGWFDKAIEYHSRALKLSKQMHDTAEIATNLSNLGINFKMTGQYEKAIDHFLETLRLDELSGNLADMSTTFNSIGMVYYAWGKHDKALEFLEIALENDRTSGDESKISIRLSNLSKLYMAMQSYEKAIKLLEEALEIDRRLGNQAKVAIRLQGLGLASLAMGQNNEALDYFEEALKIFTELGLNFKLSGLLIQIGELNFQMGNELAAEASYLDGLELALEHHLRPEEMDASKFLYNLYKSQGRMDQALYFLENFTVLKDSVFSEQSARLINEFEVKYETEKKEKQNQLLLAENRLRKQNQHFSILAIIVLFLLSGSLFWAFVLKRKSLLQSRALFVKEKEVNLLKLESIETHNQHLRESLFAEEEIKKLQAKNLERQKQELTTATMLIANKNEVFEKLRILAEQIKINDTDKEGKAREIIMEIDRQTDLSDQWEEFKIHFESIHKSFFENLRKMNGCLTQNDMQMCAYIKLNLSTKEISRLMNITPESVNTHRYRLRKKLRLINGETLDEIVHGL